MNALQRDRLLAKLQSMTDVQLGNLKWRRGTPFMVREIIDDILENRWIETFMAEDSKAEQDHGAIRARMLDADRRRIENILGTTYKEESHGEPE